MASADALEQSLPRATATCLPKKTAVRSARVQAARQVRSGTPASAAGLDQWHPVEHVGDFDLQAGPSAYRKRPAAVRLRLANR